MSDFIPKPASPKVAGLGPKAQKLQAMREKAAAQSKSGGKAEGAGAGNPAKAKNLAAGAKKTSFQRKAV
jgi:hypothetical protein